MLKLLMAFILGQAVAYTVAYNHNDAVAALPVPAVTQTCEADQQIKLIAANLETMPNIKRWVK